MKVELSSLDVALIVLEYISFILAIACMLYNYWGAACVFGVIILVVFLVLIRKVFEG